MTALILDGKHVAKLTETSLAERVMVLRERSGGRTPVLATILVGEDPASATYVKMKGNACRRVGMESLAIELPATIKTNDLLRQIEELNDNPDVHGILLQHPVPAQIDERAAFDMISLDERRRRRYLPRVWPNEHGRVCLRVRYPPGHHAPLGTLRDPDLTGKHAVVVGRSPISGQAHGDDDAASQRHRHDLPLSHTRSQEPYCPRRCDRRCSRTPGVYQSRLDQRRRGRRRRGLSPRRRRRYRAWATA